MRMSKGKIHKLGGVFDEIKLEKKKEANPMVMVGMLLEEQTKVAKQNAETNKKQVELMSAIANRPIEKPTIVMPKETPKKKNDTKLTLVGMVMRLPQPLLLNYDR